MVDFLCVYVLCLCFAELHFRFCSYYLLKLSLWAWMESSRAFQTLFYAEKMKAKISNERSYLSAPSGSIIFVAPSILSFFPISFPPSLYLSVFYLPFLSFHPCFLFLITISFSCFWPCCAAGGVSVPWAGMEPLPPLLGAWSLNHWTTREVPL